MITSSQNPKIKRIRRLLSDRRFRQREGAFVVEGTRWLAEISAAARRPETILVTARWSEDEDNRRLLEGLGAQGTLVSDGVMATTSDTETPAGVLAILPMVDTPLPDQPSLLLILDRLADPGNLGTMVRTAAAAGVDGVLLGPGCVDAYNPKAVRATMGALLRVPVLALGWMAIQEITAGMALWLAAADGPVEYSSVDWRMRSALVIGSEATGIGPEAAALGTGRLFVPMAGQTESLNAAAAAAVILFEAQRQRQHGTAEKREQGD